MAKIKFTDEELSRILSSHAGGQLGYPNFWCIGPSTTGCINQVAFNEPNTMKAVELFTTAAHVYDKSRTYYSQRNKDFPRCLETDRFLRWLETNDLA